MARRRSKYRPHGMLRVFGSTIQNMKKKYKPPKKKGQNQDGQRKELPIATEHSVHMIFIASGGMNKRY
jgi:hypothetical protein